MAPFDASEVAISNTTGASSPLGIATAIGLVPSKGSVPPHGAMWFTLEAALERDAGVDRAGASVIGAACADPADARCAREFDGELGGVSHHHMTHAPVAVDQRGRRSALQHADARARVHGAAFEPPHIAR